MLLSLAKSVIHLLSYVTLVLTHLSCICMLHGRPCICADEAIYSMVSGDVKVVGIVLARCTDTYTESVRATGFSDTWIHK